MSSTQGINVAIIGVGLVGSSVIQQLSTVAGLSSKLHIVALQNSKKTLLTSSLSSDWKSQLAQSTISALSLPELVKELQKITKTTGRHTAVVDNTSDEKVASFYPDFLAAGLSVVTPNKKAFSGSLDLYHNILKHKSNDKVGSKGPLVYQESTVGAGLPIISTLVDLINTGDEITKIEGVFSGTLSYIFNEFSTPKGGDKKFSDIVKFAKDNGYTEPHPNDDLSGSDVARKLAILSRLVPQLADALPEGYQSVPTHSLTPAPLADVASGEEYVKRLPEFDGDYDALNKEAFNNGSVLRYVGVIDVKSKEIKASLET